MTTATEDGRDEDQAVTIDPRPEAFVLADGDDGHDGPQGPSISGLSDDFRRPGAVFSQDVGGAYGVVTDPEAGTAPNAPERCRYCSADLLRPSTELKPWVCSVTEEEVTLRPAFEGLEGNRAGLQVQARAVECSCTPCLLWSRPKTAGRPRKVCENRDCRRLYERDRKRRQRKPRHGSQGSGRPIVGDGRRFVTGRNQA